MGGVWGPLVVAMVVAMAVPAAGAGGAQMRQRVGARASDQSEWRPGKEEWSGHGSSGGWSRVGWLLPSTEGTSPVAERSVGAAAEGEGEGDTIGGVGVNDANHGEENADP